MLIPGDGTGLSATESQHSASPAPLASNGATVPPHNLVASTDFAAPTIVARPIAQPAPTVIPKPPAGQAAERAPVGTSQLERPALPTEVAKVGASNVNVRSTPSTGSSVLFVLDRGDSVSVVERQDDWARIVAPNGEGWVFASYLKPPSAEEPATTDVAEKPAELPAADEALPKEAQYVRVSHRVAVLASPSRSAQTVFTLDQGQRVAVLESQGRWLRVGVSGGPTGWILSR